MCRIIGYSGHESAIPIIVDGLKKLEYRGYDSAGISVFGTKGFEVVKQKGRIAALEKRLESTPISGSMGTLVVAISCCERLYSKIFSNIEQVISRGAKVFLVSNVKEAEETDKLSLLRLPDIHELFSPSLSVIVLQLFSYFVAANKGLDIDKPRNLAKSVTVE